MSGLAGCGSGDAPRPAPARTVPGAATSAPVLTPSPAPSAVATRAPQKRGVAEAARVAGGIRVSDVSIVAQARVRSVGVYPRPGAASPQRTILHPVPSGAPLVFLVQERRSDWLRVLLGVRPNQSQGWIRAADVTLTEHDYRITVATRKHELTVYRAGTVILRAPVGLGRGTTPTPGGVFYTRELLRPPNPEGAYGPYAYGLSGYSDVLDEFLGGNGEIGIHGTDDPASVGRDVSHGCIRMRNADITKLAGILPLGVPVQILA